MKTGIDSLDTGAPDITYEGNQGPKSPQEDKRMMQEFQMAQLQEEYEKHVFEMQEQGLEPMSMEQFKDQVMSEGQMSSNQEGIGGMMQDPRTMAADGGVMQLVKENSDGSRPGYRGDDAARSSEGTSAGRADPGGSGRGDTRGDPGPAEDRGSDRQDYNTAIATGQNPLGIDMSKGPPDLTPQEKEFVKNNSLIGKTSNFVKNYIDARKKQAYDFSSLIPGQKKRSIAYAKRYQELLDEKDIDYGNLFTANEPGTYESFKALQKYRPEQSKNINAIGGLEPTINFADYLSEYEGAPGLKYSGNVGGLGDKYVKSYKIDSISGKKVPATYGYGPSTGGDGPQQILPMTTGMTTGADTDTDVASVIPYRGDQFLRRDNQLALAADGGRIGYADGGITDLRQGYFLGKLVKKATRGIKKIFKSPIAQAALLAGGGYFLRNKIPTGSSFGGKLFDKLLRMKDPTKGFDPFKIGIGGLSALTYLKGKQDEEDEPSLDEYLSSASRGPSLNIRGIRDQIAANKGNINPQDFAFLNKDFYQTAADGGRIGLAAGGIGNLRAALTNQMFGYDEDEEDKKLAFGGSAGMPPVTLKAAGIDMQSFGDDESKGMDQGPTMKSQMPMQKPMMDPRMMQMMMAQQGGQGRMMAAMGGRMGYAEGGESEELLDMGGMEKDYRNDGGFVPMGEYERKDDVPARLSKNEFVFTADAVRNAGGGDIDKGAEIMENMMKNLENGGQVSQGSQGLEGAREMFQTQQRLGEVL